MFKLPKQICLIATFILMFALCSPILSYLAWVLILSQNVSSLIAMLLGVLVGISIYYYLPVICDYSKYIFNLLKD